MKKLLHTFLLTFTLLLVPATAMAIDIINPACQSGNGVDQSTVCTSNTAVKDKNPLFGPEGVLTISINILSLIVGVVAIIVIFVAAIRFTTSQNNPQTITSARNQIIYAVIGIVVALVSQGLVLLVLNRL